MEKNKECKHCGKYMYHDEARKFHETSCLYNPKRSACSVCEYAEVYDVNFKYRTYRHISCAVGIEKCLFTPIDAEQKVKDAREEERQSLLKEIEDGEIN